MSSNQKDRPLITALQRAVNPPRIAFEAGASLFMEKPTNPTVRRKALYDELASAPTSEALNSTDEVFGRFLSVLEKKQIPVSSIILDKNIYWMSGVSYNMLEVVGTSAQFFDHHDAPLPQTTLPPVGHLEAFIERVLNQPNPLTVDQQFDMLLEITGNNVVGAANLGMLATRFMSRFADNRAYPEVRIGGRVFTADTPDIEINEMIRKWDSKIARFVTANEHGMNDGLGDNYYFWTHVFGAMVLNINGVLPKAMDKVFERGTELMIFAKYTIARRRGHILPHREASEAGKAVGLELIKLAEKQMNNDSRSRFKSRRSNSPISPD